MRCLLECVGDLDQHGFGPRVSQDLEASWKRFSPNEAHRHSQSWKAGGWSRILTVISVRRSHVPYEAWGIAPARVDEGLHLILGHCSP